MGFAHYLKILTSRCTFPAVLMVATWMHSKRLQLNANKTDFIGLSSSRRPDTTLWVGSDVVTTVSIVRDLGIYLDSDMSARSHFGKMVSSCFAIPRHLRSICRSVTKTVLQSMVVLLVLSWLVTRPWQAFLRTFFSDFSRYWMQPLGWYSRHRGSTTSPRCFADFIGWRLLRHHI